MRGLLVIVLVVGCGDNLPAGTIEPEPCTGDTTCVSDPSAHCITDERCIDDSECPAGTACLATHAGPCGDDTRRRCRTRYLSYFDELPLIRFFDVPEMDIWLDDDNPLVRWNAPPESTIVACALFTCPPQLAFVDAGDGHGGVEILNFDRCVLLFAATPAQRGLFALDWENHQNIHPISCADPVTYRRAFEDLLVGCWAYDKSRLIAATQLQRIPPGRVAHLSVPATTTCPENEGDGPECFRENDKTFGLCVNGTCRRRCRQAADCEPSSTGDTCYWECAPVERSLLGVCKQTPPLPP